jgi:hypothetical protein
VLTGASVDGLGSESTGMAGGSHRGLTQYMRPNPPRQEGETVPNENQVPLNGAGRGCLLGAESWNRDPPDSVAPGPERWAFSPSPGPVRWLSQRSG